MPDFAHTTGKVNFSLLQIFRGWAAVLVVLVHSSAIASEQHHHPFLGNFFAMGNAGVDFFFVLSGFLIFHIHGKDFGQPRQLTSYLWKRIVRIFPIYWLVTLLILPVYFIVAHYGQGDETHASIILGSLLLVPMARAPILVAGWSLRHELLFYFWFVLLIGLRPRWAWPIIGLWVASMLVSVGLSFGTAYRYSHPVIHLLLWPQNFEFIVGCLAAVLLYKLPVGILSRPMCIGLLLAGLGGFLATGFFPGPLFDLARSEHVLLYGGLSFIIVITSTSLDLSGGFSNRIKYSLPYRGFDYLGEASYSLYLLHGPVISILFKLAGAQSLYSSFSGSFITPVIVILTVGAGCFFHTFVERPLLRRVRRRETIAQQ